MRELSATFWRRIDQVIHEFEQLPRSGETAYGFAVGLYPVPDRSETSAIKAVQAAAT
jgi:hypothetical protein